MADVSFIALFSAVGAIFSILLALNIFNKVYQENYKKPWLFIGISTIFIGLSQLLRFFGGFYGLYLINSSTHEALTLLSDFIAIIILGYALVLEFLILKYYKGKFVKMKLIPVQEGTLGGELDINISNGNSYLALKKDRNFLFEQFSQATKKGFEGFAITELTPKDFRSKYNVQRSPIAWVSQIDKDIESNYLKQILDENSEAVDPLHINNLISYIDNFLEQSKNPFIVLELNQFLKSNNNSIVFEFLKYVANKIKKFDGILICMINSDVLDKGDEQDLRDFLKELE